MSVNFTANGQNYSATTGLPAANVVTVTCFAILDTITATFENICGLTNGGAANWSLATPAAGTTIGVFDNGSYDPGGAPFGATTITTGVWWQFGVVINAANIAFYRAPVGQALAVTTATNFSPPATATSMKIGEYPDDVNLRWSGRLAGMKWWQGALTAAEVTAELGQISPVRWSNLLRYHPFRQADTADWSGRGNTLSGGTGATSGVDPPIPMFAYPQRDNAVARTRLRSG